MRSQLCEDKNQRDNQHDKSNKAAELGCIKSAPSGVCFGSTERGEDDDKQQSSEEDGSDLRQAHNDLRTLKWEERLTNSSSATGTGEARLDYEEKQNAGACSLERVVRPAPTERFWTAGKEGHGSRRGNEGRCRRKRMNGGTGWLKEEACRQRNGNTLSIEEPHARDSGPNELQAQRRRLAKQEAWINRQRAERQPPFAGAPC